MKKLFFTFLLIALIVLGFTAVSHHTLSSLAAVEGTAVSANAAFFFDSGQLLSEAGSAVALGDLNGNGHPDLFIARNGPDTVWFNEGDGTYTDSGQSLGSGWSLAVALGDLDGDGDLDAVVVQDTAGSPSLVIYFNQGGQQGGTPGVFLPGGQAIGGDLATGVALGDLNGNGYLDIFLTRGTGRPSQVWFNDGVGVFTDSGQSLTSNSQAVALGDFDGDGDLDAVVADGDAARLLWNMGGAQGGTEGVFTDSGQSLPASFSADVGVGDLDGDGDLDVVIATMNGGILTWINQGGAQGGVPGQFAPGDFPNGPNGNRALALGDLDGDGDLDIFVARSGGNMVWLNQGGQQGGVEGLFADSGQQLGDLFSEAVALGDVDGDGDLDAIVANFDGPTQVWLNQAGPDLLVYELVRDVILMSTGIGQHYIGLFYANWPEIGALLDDHPDLDAAGEATLQLWQPNLWALVQGNGDDAIITAAQTTAMDNFLTQLAAVASPDLQQTIAAEHKQLGPLEDYVGLTMTEARGIVIGYSLKLPLIRRD